jgi:aminotransferase
VQTEASRRDRLARFLRARNVYTTFRYYPLHLVARYGSNASLPVAEAAAYSTLCIPIHQSMSDDDVERVVGLVREFFAGS